jgi:hypothetical protein
VTDAGVAVAVRLFGHTGIYLAWDRYVEWGLGAQGPAAQD